MSWLAGRLARFVWFGMLWFMRRPPIKRLRRSSVLLVPSRCRERAWRSVVRQDRFARRWGLLTLTLMFNLLLASTLVSGSIVAATALYEAGVFTPPVELR
jgi:hypothetical protein